MINRYKNIFFLITFFTFFFFISKYYFSEENKIYTNKSRSSYLHNFNIDAEDLILLKNDTKNIIVYLNEIEEFKKKRKKRFWEKLISN